MSAMFFLIGSSGEFHVVFEHFEDIQNLISNVLKIN